MAFLRVFLALYSIVCVSCISDDFSMQNDGDCYPECQCSCDYDGTLEIDCMGKNLTEIPDCAWENATRM